ncbi:uncharacterized protein, partial [Eurosta solidaginis]|uniref:uncharacterized protein n=1 Tax=Eurosta solidaginis TaxID=178769 RepID=UPI003530CD39
FSKIKPITVSRSYNLLFLLSFNYSNCVPITLGRIVKNGCFRSEVEGAKIINPAINATVIYTNASIATNDSPVAVKVIIIPTTKPNTTSIGAIAETKENIKDDRIENINKNAAAVNEDDGDEDDDDDDDYDNYENKTKSETALEAADKDDDTSSAFSVWGVVRSMWNWLRDDISESIFGGDDDISAAGGVTRALARQMRSIANVAKSAVESRTFGKIRRLQMALVPLIFKFGVLTAMVAFLIMLGMKTLFLVKLLVLMNAAAILAKFITLKSGFIGHEEHHAPAWNYQSWAPPAGGGWVATAPAAPIQIPSKEIHLHIHGGKVQDYGADGHGVVSTGHGWVSRSDPYAAYASAQENDVNNELNDLGPIGMLPTRYPPNHS